MSLFSGFDVVGVPETGFQVSSSQVYIILRYTYLSIRRLYQSLLSRLYRLFRFFYSRRRKVEIGRRQVRLLKTRRMADDVALVLKRRFRDLPRPFIPVRDWKADQDLQVRVHQCANYRHETVSDTLGFVISL